MTKKQDHNKNSLNLQDKYKAAKHIHFDEIHSTNTWAKENSHEWARNGVTLITASGQSGGRGRFNRHWHSPKGFNIYATFCFWMSPERSDIGQIPQLMALAAACVLENHQFHPLLKWPNDLLLNGKKVGGILCETILQGHERGVICGIGINVNMPQNEINKIDRPATSLSIESNKSFNVEMLLEELQIAFISFLYVFLKSDFSSFFSSFMQRSAIQSGMPVRFHDNQNIVEATFISLNHDGSIDLLLKDGRKKTYFAGEFVE